MVNPILAAVLSFFIPGLGQALSGEVGKGVMYFIGAVILLIIVNLFLKNWLASIINLLYSLYVAYNAYKIAE